MDDALNLPVISYCITYLTKMKDYFLDNWPYDMNGSLILIALDHNTNLCDVKIIDNA